MRKTTRIIHITWLALVMFFCIATINHGISSSQGLAPLGLIIQDENNKTLYPLDMLYTNNGEMLYYEFVDYDDRLIKTSTKPIEEPIPYPEPPYRENTVFVEWVLVSNEGNRFLYKAQYKLDQYQLEIETFFKIYDWNPYELKVLNPFDGLTYKIKQGGDKYPGVYNIDVLVYLDGIFQYSTKHKVVIIDDLDPVSYKDKDKIKHLSTFLESLNESDQALLQAEIDRLTLEYNSYIDHVNTMYKKTDSFKFNLNIYAFIGSVQLSIIGLYWRKKS